MNRISSVAPETATQDAQGDAPALGFAPVLSAGSVTDVTRGRQTFNDSDKDNYFEG
ncbi:hypothetical protein ACWG5P_28140 [Streptomyces prasinus]